MSRDRRSLSRRSLVSGTVGLALVGRAAAAQTPSPAAGGGWTFTDDNGTTLSAPAVPQTIVAQSSAGAALYDFGVQIAGIYGPSRTADGKPDFQVGNLPLDDLVVLGDYGSSALELDIEALIELDPDLIVDMLQDTDTFWYLSGDARTQVDKLGIPEAGIWMQRVSILDSIKRFGELAASLGADLDAPKVSDAMARHAEAETRLREVIEGKPGLKVLVLAPAQDIVYICSPRIMTDLHYFADLGLEIVDHDGDSYFKEISWEELASYPADLILLDARSSSLPEAEMPAVWQTLPAVQAGQTGKWYAGAPYSYSRLVPIMDELAADIDRSSVVAE